PPPAYGPPPRVRTGAGSVLWLPPSHRGRCSYNHARASCVGAPAPGANNSWLGVLASPFAPGAVLLQSTCSSCVGAPPGCERGDGRSPSQLPTQSVDNSVSSLGATAAGARHDRLGGISFKKWTTPTDRSQKECSCGSKPHYYGAVASLIRKNVD